MALLKLKMGILRTSGEANGEPIASLELTIMQSQGGFAF
jgi:hypothetical protein